MIDLIPMPSLNVGLVGTGYAARLRAETFYADPRSCLVVVAGHDLDRTTEFSQPFEAESLTDWNMLVQREDIDLVVIATINRDHGAIAHAAIRAGKHVVVEYPLSIHLSEAQEIIALTGSQNTLLHVEHIELLSGIHSAIVSALPEIGTPFYARYASINPQQPAPQKWTYSTELFGFPTVGALSRVNRLLHLFGPVSTVSSQSRFWDATKEMQPDAPGLYTTCMCSAQLRFVNGVMADLVYGKGEALWAAERKLEIHGDRGLITIEGDQGLLVQPDATRPLDMGSRRGLFAKDTQMVLDYLTKGTPLYTTTADSLYALTIAEAMRHSAKTGQTIHIEP
jgi:biliverdin reductase